MNDSNLYKEVLSEFCPLCETSKFELLHDKDRFNETLLNYVCNECGFVQVLPRPDDNFHKEQYENGKFSKQARGYSTPPPSKISRAESIAFANFTKLKAVLGLERLRSINSILEIGCGAGSFLRLMKALGAETLGIEPDSDYAQYGRIHYEVNIESLLFETFEKDLKFDCIASFHVIEHVSNPAAFVQKIHDYLNDDGLLYIECPTLDKMYGPNENHFFWAPHVNSFSNISLKYLLEKNGFKIIELCNHRGFVNVVAQKTTIQEGLTLMVDSSQRIRALLADKAQVINPITPVRKDLKFQVYRVKQKSKRFIDKLINAVKERKELSEKGEVKYKMAHIGLHNSGNTGDIALFHSVRRQYENNLGRIEWTLFDVHKPVTEELINQLNKFDAIIIGGGGLFLADTNTNAISGWQWAIPIESYDKIETPIIVHAVGYNRFRGQAEFSSVFPDNVNKLIETSKFIGLRNKGSIKKMKDYLQGTDNEHKISFQPCPTTQMSQLFPEFVTRKKNSGKKIAINIAFDRHHLRYGNFTKADLILNEICEALKMLQNEGFEIINLIHGERDGEFNIWANKNNLIIKDLNLIGANMKEMMKAYSDLSLVIGTRGHAQMIPFGLDVSIISLISHDKLRYFLEDINMTERGIEINDEMLRSSLYEKSTFYINRQDYTTAKKEFEKNIKSNFISIESSLHEKHRS